MDDEKECDEMSHATLTDENGEVILEWDGKSPLPNDELPRMVSRFEEMLREQQTIAESLKDLADEAKEKGFDVAAIRKAASLRINSKARLKYEKSTKTLLDLMESIDDPLVVR